MGRKNGLLPSTIIEHRIVWLERDLQRSSFVPILRPCPIAGVWLHPHSILLSGESCEGRVGAAEGRARGCLPHRSPLPSNQRSGEIACYLGSIFHALLNCFVLTHCQKWIVTLTQPELGRGLQACAVELMSLQVEGRLGEWWGAQGLSLSLVSSWVCRHVLQCFLKDIYEADEAVKGEAC